MSKILCFPQPRLITRVKGVRMFHAPLYLRSEPRMTHPRFVKVKFSCYKVAEVYYAVFLLHPTLMKYPTRLFASAAALFMANVAVSATLGLMAKPAHGLPFVTRTQPLDHEFEACAESLIDLEIALATTVDACGAAQEPKDLSKCVKQISNNTAITSDDALAGCVRVRRPADMAKCVVTLDSEFEGTLSAQVLGHCGRSLLPSVFENCVEGIYDADTTDPMMVMGACVEPDFDAPQVFLPTFQRVTSDS